jgi:hypothetical protein
MRGGISAELINDGYKLSGAAEHLRRWCKQCSG